MSNRSASEHSESISLFPFLAVLLCTMGALLVMLVILVRGAAERALLPAANKPSAAEVAKPLPSSPAAASAEAEERLKRELAEIAAYQRELETLRAEAQRRLGDARARLSHAEEHARRLEEELARLTIAAEQLKQTEQNQSVNQDQAEEELARLEQLIVDTEAMLETLRKDASGKKSYAIVPYQGPNGTYRKPIYIECSDKGVTIQPEGLVLTEEDFLAPNWPGNPLASVLRASREYLNEQAARDGRSEPPDPYPLLLVRPSGDKFYELCYFAIKCWDADYGYEFIEEDMKLAYREGVDPELARVQHHALLVARERLVRLVQSAPSRFRHVQSLRGIPTRMDGTPSNAAFTGPGEYVATGTGDQTALVAETHAAGRTTVPGDQPEIGNLGGNPPAGETGDEQSQGFATGAEAESAGAVADGPELVGPRYAQQGAGTNAPSEPLSGVEQTQQAAGATAGGMRATQAIADNKGAHWATGRPNVRSMAIRRPIPVVVRENKMILQPTTNNRRSVESQAREISLDQSIHEISERFAAAVQERIEDWGLAGSGMYWKPVLELTVEPNAELTATRIVHLLRDSGVEVQLPQTARASQAGPGGTVP